MPNRLADEPSPYLRQHAGNPVDWWPWGEAAFAEARRRGVPVFLSVGYSTCHWCHVMAHESFEDAEVARRLNEAFVCVKVDREERPDVDEVYMAACQAMTGSGGWPLTVLLTPDKRPFFAGTYFPKESRLGRMGMLDLVPAVADAWRTRRAELERQADHVMQHVRGEPHGHEEREAKPKPPQPSDPVEVLRAGAAAILRRFDAERGGFGGAPKFPSPHLLLFLLRWHHRTGDAAALDAVRRTAEAMARGGIHDHLGGGFHRYSTDAEWRVPHFEKMLYDQAMLALAYTELHQATGDPAAAATARSTLDYVVRDLSDPAGGLRCAEDADSEGEEGRFYVWTREEILGVLGTEAGARLADAYGIPGSGAGAGVLHLEGPAAAAPAGAAPLLGKLLAARGKRVRPHLDDKVLTDWSGLAIAALARAGTALGEPRFTAAAERAAGFMRREMRRADGGLRHRWRAGARDESAFLDDHAFLLWGLVELYEATCKPDWLAWAAEVAGRLEEGFTAPEGGFFQTPAGAEDLGARRREATDGAIPSGNSAAAHALLRLGLLTGEARWTRLGERTLEAFLPDAARIPAAFAMLLCALDLAAGPTQEIVVAGEGEEAEAMVALARQGFRPRAVLLRLRPGLDKVAPWTREMGAKEARAYVCEGFACRAPVTSPRTLAPLLAQRPPAPTIPGSRRPAP